MKQKFVLFLILVHMTFLFGDEEREIIVNFPTVSMHELVKFASKVAGVNFIGDPKLLDFEVSFLSGKPLGSEQMLSILIQMLEEHGLEVKRQNDCLIISKKAPISTTEQKPSELPITPIQLPVKEKSEGKFQIIKLQYHQGSEILEALKQISNDLIETNSGTDEMVSAISSMQWIKSTNSLFFSGSPYAIEKVCKLVDSLDTALKQVLIEVLVVETSLKNSLDFGLEWSFSSKYKDSAGIGAGNFKGSDFSQSINHLGIGDKDAGLLQSPFLRGFDLGIIGDIIFHKGRSFVSLGSLISALQIDGESSIVLNQKLISQENKSSRIFVGDNIPFAGSMVQTVGNGQQTTANVEYRDIGVSLNITPLLGEGDIITLEISEEITEAMDHLIHKSNQLSGIKTSKTNMSTSAHVPDGHFLILSGMTKTIKAKATSGPPCLGGLPLIGHLFNKKEKNEEKSNLLIFVRPHIIRSTDEYKQISSSLSDKTNPI
jgi:type III secretion protein C